MKITSLEVDGFGIWSGLELAELTDDLNVFYGPNEAGKTTLVEFLRSMFYGVSPQRRAQYLPPVRGGRGGGTLRVAAGAKTFALARHADERGDVFETTLSEDGQPLASMAAWPGLLGGIDETIFNNVFAFGLHEIQELATLADSQAAEELYNLALGLDRVSLVDVLGELEASRMRLLAADDRPSLVTQLLGQRERLLAEIDAASQATHRYLSLVAQREQVAGEVRRLEAETSELDIQAREAALARALAERWQRRGAIDERLAAVAGGASLPEDALARFERITARLAARRRRLKRLKGERHELRRAIDELAINESLCRQALRLEALAEQQQWMASLEAQSTELAAEIARLEATSQETHKQLGLTAAGDPRALEPVSRRALDELRVAARAVRKALAEGQELVAKASAAREAAAAVQRQLDTARGPGGTVELTQALATSGELVSQLRSRVHLDGRLDQMTRNETELEEQVNEHLEGQMLPTWALAALGSLFVLGCGLLLLFLAGLVLPASLSGSLGWPVGLIGLLAVGVAAGSKIGLEHASAMQLDACQGQLQQLRQQIEQAKQERDDLDGRIPRGGGPLSVRLQAAEKELARLEDLLPLESNREAAGREAEAAEVALADLGNTLARARQQWRRLLTERGLPAALKPRDLKHYVQRRNEIGGLADAIAGKRGELSRVRSAYDALAQRITQVIVDVGAVPQGVRPLERLRGCLAELAEQQSRLRRREEMTRQTDALARRWAQGARKADRLRARRLHLLRAAGTNDEHEFRRRAAAQAEVAALAAERARIVQEIETALAGRSTEERIAALLGDPIGLAAVEARIAEARGTAMAKLGEVQTTRGEINQQLKMLVEDRTLAHKRIELGTVERRLQDALERWRVLTICRVMLIKVRDYYEREHQPQALREASEYLKRMTAGRYTRVWTPLGQHALVVDDAQGQSLTVEVLSRGTREQLFLALRLALLNAFARKGANLPLVLDDVLVNFDVGRAKAAATVLRDFAKAGHQVLVFTCHEHIARLFKQLKAEVRQLPDNGQALAWLDEEPARRRTRRVRPEPLPEEPADEPEIAPPIEPAEVAAELPPPLVEVPRVPSPKRRVAPKADRVKWNAEEFEGELTDRIRRDAG